MKDGLEGLLTKVTELSAKVPLESKATSNGNPDVPPPTPTETYNFSTSDVATHFEAKTGPELAVCALAKIEIVNKNTGATRTDILTEMKSAKAYYNNNMSGNLSKILKTLTTNKRINHGVGDMYSLSASERKSFEGKIANIG